jgi:hypothetical protein
MEDKIATWPLYELARHHHVPRGVMPRETCSSAYKTDPPPSHFQHDLAWALGSLSVRIGRNRGFGGSLEGVFG